MLRFLLLLLVFPASAQHRFVISTQDVYNFWRTFDAVEQEPDSSKAVTIIQSEYIDKGSKGLHYFIQSRQFTPGQWYRVIKKYPKYLSSIRQKSIQLDAQKETIEAALNRFYKIYPAFKKPSIYFCIGTLSTGGTTRNGDILIGTELLIGDSTSTLTELPAFFQNLAYTAPQKTIHYVVHEACHSQQKTVGYGYKTCLLGLALQEGMCDFITELLLNHPIDYLPYVDYGHKHKKELWHKFKPHLFSTSSDIRDQWFYNSVDMPFGQGDLGYYIGYEIAKSYYQQAIDKRKAIKSLLQLDTDNPKALKVFLSQSGFSG